MVDHSLMQEESIASCRCLWHSILDQELTLIAQTIQRLKRYGAMPRNVEKFRVDSMLVHGSKALHENIGSKRFDRRRDVGTKTKQA